MQKKIKAALISVFYKDGIEALANTLVANNVTIYSTGGTQTYLENLGITCIGVEAVTEYPSILGGRVKTLHPKMFGGILARRDNEQDSKEMEQYAIPEIDLVIVDLYPFEETLKTLLSEDNNTTSTVSFEEGNSEAIKKIIEKIDIGGPSMIRAAAKNYSSVVSIANKDDYETLNNILISQQGTTTIEQRKQFAAKAFNIVMHYDVAINNYFSPSNSYPVLNPSQQQVLRYGENPHQQGIYYGNLAEQFSQLHGKELSYNNLVDVDAALQLSTDMLPLLKVTEAFFAIIKHTNVCGVGVTNTVCEAWQLALAGDPESAFGGVLVCNQPIDELTANAINEIFFEVLLAPSFSEAALTLLQSKKNRILLQTKNNIVSPQQYKSILGGHLVQQQDEGNYTTWNEVGGRNCTDLEKQDLEIANIICKHLKSNAIALVKNKQLIGKGCGQTSRIDALRQAIEKATHFKATISGAVLASDAFFPFADCVTIAHQAGISAFVQPGGSIRDKDTIAYCQANNLAMVLTELRHFKH